MDLISQLTLLPHCALPDIINLSSSTTFPAIPFFWIILWEGQPLHFPTVSSIGKGGSRLVQTVPAIGKGRPRIFQTVPAIGEEGYRIFLMRHRIFYLDPCAGQVVPCIFPVVPPIGQVGYIIF